MSYPSLMHSHAHPMAPPQPARGGGEVEAGGANVHTNQEVAT